MDSPCGAIRQAIMATPQNPPQRIFTVPAARKIKPANDSALYPADRHDGLTCGLSILRWNTRRHHHVLTPNNTRRMDSPFGAIRRAMQATPQNPPQRIFTVTPPRKINPTNKLESYPLDR
ncbi:hypothetical protein SAMN05216264_11210 [Pseudomonas marincola]|nr:hypothetical protein SAMN05216264_11210 [Pseudomonas marincola]